jgi:hypothetical protein
MPSPTTNPPRSSSPTSSRTSSVRSQNLPQHAPIIPSGLREAHTMSQSPDDRRVGEDGVTVGTTASTSKSHASAEADLADDTADATTSLLGNIRQTASGSATEITSLLRQPIEFITGHAHPGPCDHGTFSPQPGSKAASIREGRGDFGGAYPGGRSSPRGVSAEPNGNGIKKMTTTEWLAQQHGITNTRTM